VPPLTLVPGVRAIVAHADPQQPISDVRLLSDVVAAETAPRRVQVRVLGTFAFAAFLLAGIGLYGLLAHDVSKRAREIGVRLALGAERRDIILMVMRRGLRLAFAGVVIGVMLAFSVGRSLKAVLAGVSSTDALTYSAAVGLTMLMTALGSLLPALRALHVNPIEVIRSE
jgi:ABC-type antimicrobial peptide transport system permease subunit